MKMYFDNLDLNSSNQNQLCIKNGKPWLVASGAPIKEEAISAGITISTIDNLADPGCYVIDVLGDPLSWTGSVIKEDMPDKHILLEIDKKIIQLAKDKKIRIVIAADREGGSMMFDNLDMFKLTHDVMQNLNLPPQSVLIAMGNKKAHDQYRSWLNGNTPLMEIMYLNHFTKIFVDKSTVLPETPIIKKSIKTNKVYDYNSLNRVYRPHRGAHLYTIAKENLLDKGLVSANSIATHDKIGASLTGIHYKQFINDLNKYYPKYIDGNWKDVNAANSFNLEIYEKSLISFITETMFLDDSVFLTEKIFKPIMMGHPLIVLASAGTLSGLRDLGFRTDWCGIDPQYNDIKDHKERFDKTHHELFKWVSLPATEKIARITDSIDTIQYNFDLIRSKNFYHDGLIDIIKKTETYFES